MPVYRIRRKVSHFVETTIEAESREALRVFLATVGGIDARMLREFMDPQKPEEFSEYDLDESRGKPQLRLVQNRLMRCK